MANRTRSHHVGHRRRTTSTRGLLANNNPLRSSKTLPSRSPNSSNSSPINRANSHIPGLRLCRTFTRRITKTSTLGSRLPTMASRLSSTRPCIPSRASNKDNSNRRSRPNSLSSSKLNRSRHPDLCIRTSNTARATSSSLSLTIRTTSRRSSSSLVLKVAVSRVFSGALDKLARQ